MEQCKLNFILSIVLMWSIGLFAQVELTVYNQNLGLVKEQRTIRLKKGLNEINFTDVASQIDATSVHFKSITAPDAVTVLEQNFEYDLVSRDKLLQKYIDKGIEMVRRFGVSGEKVETLKGTLLSTRDGLTLKVGDNIYLNPTGEVILAKLPEGFVTKPTLNWLLNSEQAGEHKVEVGYLTNGINWNADYVIVVDKDDKKIDLNGWVTINNQSGATYRDAKLKLIAGDIHRVSPPSVPTYDRMLFAEKAAAAPQFEEKPFFEYHMYTLQRTTTIRDNETKQIEFAQASQVPVRKLFIYDGSRIPFYGYSQYSRADQRFGTQSNKEVMVMLEFKNSKDNNLGIPLPKGRMRVYKEDTDKTLQFIGEDWIEHTPKDEPVRIYLGNAFDIVGERVQTDFKRGDDWVIESYKITLRNHKDDAVEIKVVEHLYRWSNWKIIEKSQDYEKRDARTIEFTLPIPANSERAITYTVRYWW
ncbi:MAG: DUF4139 domain-containing protein [candidate division WOR-3 bacterium]